MASTAKETMDNVLKVLFDGECPLCKREINWLKTRKQVLPVDYIDISLPSFSAEQYGFTQALVMAEMTAVLNEKKLIGMEVFRELYSRVGLGWLLWITNFTPFKQVADFGYSIFARNRLRLTGRCDTKC